MKEDQKKPFSSYFSILAYCLNCWFYPMETSAAEILQLKICTSQLPKGWSCLPIAARVDINCDFQFAECHILTLHRWRMQTKEVKSESLWLPDIPRKKCVVFKTPALRILCIFCQMQKRSSWVFFEYLICADKRISTGTSTQSL